MLSSSASGIGTATSCSWVLVQPGQKYRSAAGASAGSAPQSAANTHRSQRCHDRAHLPCTMTSHPTHDCPQYRHVAFEQVVQAAVTMALRPHCSHLVSSVRAFFSEDVFCTTWSSRSPRLPAFDISTTAQNVRLCSLPVFTGCATIMIGSESVLVRAQLENRHNTLNSPCVFHEAHRLLHETRRIAIFPD